MHFLYEMRGDLPEKGTEYQQDQIICGRAKTEKTMPDGSEKRVFPVFLTAANKDVVLYKLRPYFYEKSTVQWRHGKSERRLP